VAGLMVYNTTTNKPNFYNGTEWFNFDRTSAITLIVGVNYQGGKIAYIFQFGDAGFIVGETFGIIAATTDQSGVFLWGCLDVNIPGADGTATATGNQNTIDILQGCTDTGIEARICGDLVLNRYSDWYLPSKDELNKWYENRVAIGGFSSGLYMNSSEVGATKYFWL